MVRIQGTEILRIKRVYKIRGQSEGKYMHILDCQVKIMTQINLYIGTVWPEKLSGWSIDLYYRIYPDYWDNLIT